MRAYCVYILTNWNNEVMYIGVTNDLQRRLYEHRNGLVDGFTKRYRVHKLVYYEEASNIYEAIAREKQLKGWSRRKKMLLLRRRIRNGRTLGWSGKDPSTPLRSAQDDRMEGVHQTDSTTLHFRRRFLRLRFHRARPLSGCLMLSYGSNPAKACYKIVASS